MIQVVDNVECLQCKLNILSKWCHDHGLIINAKKTKLMHVHPVSFPAEQIDLVIDNSCPITRVERIELVKSYRYLGVVVDEH